MRRPPIALCLAALLLLAPARFCPASEPNPEDTSALAHSSPAGSLVPQPTMPGELKKPSEEQPLPLRLIVRPLRGNRGMLITLPMIDTDPNRGFTFGFLPIWIINTSTAADSRIREMHAPSVTFNPTFKTNFTHRYYYYPTKDSSLMLRGAVSQVVEKELFAQYDNSNVFGKNGEMGWKLQYNYDGSNRFFGFGPRSGKDLSANYVLQTNISDAYFGLPIREGSNWYWTVENRWAGNKVADGPVKSKSVQGITAVFPGLAPAHYHQSNAMRGYITYDSLDNSVTTTRGTYAEFFAESSQRAWASEYAFQRYSVDVRHFQQNRPDDDTFVTAMRYKFEQVVGDGVPLWLQPSLGGKYLFPAYSDGRFTTLGVMAAVVEERMILFRIKTAGVLTKYELAPFTGLGSAFDTPGKMRRREVRPMFGLGLRAIAPPQVVGSIDFGFGQEGLAAFMDINYPF